MDDIELASEGAFATGPRARPAGQGFASDADRGFIYRVVAVHARAGVEPHESAARLARMLAEPAAGETAAAGMRRRSRAYGAERLAAALAEAAQGAPDALIHTRLADAGLVLTAEESAAFCVPASCLDRLPLAAELFAAVASVVSETGRA